MIELLMSKQMMPSPPLPPEEVISINSTGIQTDLSLHRRVNDIATSTSTWVSSSGSQGSAYNPWKAADGFWPSGTNNGAYLSGSNTILPQWVQYEFSTPRKATGMALWAQSSGTVGGGCHTFELLAGDTEETLTRIFSVLTPRQDAGYVVNTNPITDGYVNKFNRTAKIWRLNILSYNSTPSTRKPGIQEWMLVVK